MKYSSCLVLRLILLYKAILVFIDKFDINVELLKFNGYELLCLSKSRVNIRCCGHVCPGLCGGGDPVSSVVGSTTSLRASHALCETSSLHHAITASGAAGSHIGDAPASGDAAGDVSN